jgi:hypothetical protein
VTALRIERQNFDSFQTNIQLAHDGAVGRTIDDALHNILHVKPYRNSSPVICNNSGHNAFCVLLFPSSDVNQRHQPP